MDLSYIPYASMGLAFNIGGMHDACTTCTYIILNSIRMPFKYSSNLSSTGDVYSFAMVLYEIATLNVPFSGVDPALVVMAVREGQRPDIPPNVPDALRHVITSCWAQAPRDRPSFSWIVDELQRAAQELAATGGRRLVLQGSFKAPGR